MRAQLRCNLLPGCRAVVQVHNQAGYLARVELSLEFPGIDPQAIWDVLVHPGKHGQRPTTRHVAAGA